MDCIVDFYVDLVMCFVFCLYHRGGHMRMNWGVLLCRSFTRTSFTKMVTDNFDYTNYLKTQT